MAFLTNNSTNIWDNSKLSKEINRIIRLQTLKK